MSESGLKVIAVKPKGVLKVVLTLFLLGVIPAEAQMPPIRVACIGNSITIGYGLPDPNSAYPQQAGRLLGNRYEIRNFGVSGRTMLKKGDYPYWKEDFYKEALAFKPQIVMICLGMNDGADFFDGIHPDSTGDSIMARIVYDAIQKSPSGMIRYFISSRYDSSSSGPVALYWETTKSSVVTINGARVSESDSMTVYPDKTTVYTLAASGAVSGTSAIKIKRARR